MGWFSSRKASTEAHAPLGTLLGIDLNATRFRAVSGGVSDGRDHRSENPTGPNRSNQRLLKLDDPDIDLPLAISFEGRSPIAGREGVSLTRRLPHLQCSDYLPYLGQPREWQLGRFRLDAIAAMDIALERLKQSVSGFEVLTCAVPTYLSVAQMSKLIPLFQKHKLPIGGTVVSSLAIAADRANPLTSNSSQVPNSERLGEWVLPLHRSAQPIHIVIVDGDDYALTVSLISIDDKQVKMLSHITLTRLGGKVWKDRLLDSLSDRCIRLCRRDPRDSADAEQSLYEQMNEGLDRLYHGQNVALTVRSTHWYQDLILPPEDWESFVAPLARSTVTAMTEMLSAAPLLEPIHAIWLTHDAGRLPGLRKAIHQHVAERTNVSVLSIDAIASACNHLTERWKLGEIPRVHLDTSIPLPPRPSDKKAKLSTDETRIKKGS